MVLDRQVKLLRQRYPLVTTTLVLAGKEWKITSVENQEVLLDNVETDRDLNDFPYGLLLWASSVGLAERLADEPKRVRGRSVLELGAGAGLPGLMARHLGGKVAQTDYQKEALTLTRLNAQQNGMTGIRHFQADWRQFDHDGRYDLILGSDVLYERALHYELMKVVERSLVPGGLLLISDPIRPQAMEFIDRMEAAGWSLKLESQHVPWETESQEIALFFLRR